MKKHYPFLFLLAVYALIFAFLQTYSEYHFYFVEQNQLFQSSWPYVSEHLMQPGGAALVVSEFLVQFFLLPGAGAGITAALITAAGWLAYRIIRRVRPGVSLVVLCLLPALTLLFVHFDFNYIASGTVAFLMAEAAFCLVLGIKDVRWRFAAHATVIPALFLLAGPVFMLYTALALIAPLPSRKLELWGKVALAAGTLLIGILGVYFALYAEYRHVFLPDGYYHFSLKPHSVIYFSWISLSLIFALACFLGKRRADGKADRKKLNRYGIPLQIALLAFAGYFGVQAYSDKGSYMMKELGYYSRTGQWDKVLERCRGKLSNYLYMAYANLALTERGELGDRMFAFDQHGTQGLLIDWNRTASVSILLSDIYFAVNATALSQEMAFEAYTSAIGDGNPRMMKRLVQTNLINGSYAVAEKYISILENTLCYRAWAREQRRFLDNDAEVEGDALLGNKRRSLMPDASLAMIDGIEAELQGIASANPSDRAAIEYAGAIYLLGKDMDGFRELIDKYFATPVLPALPVAFQEAAIILSEKDPDYLRRFDISEAVASRFAQYKRQVVEGNRSANANALPSLLLRAYGDTYWYYFMFK
ncbi:MAG: DUF6057 family protein [Tannerellaceae bacterium]|jgi:hypothetical protein|nr:DUF6057 family protein [Tannerellaceae bacterium]